MRFLLAFFLLFSCVLHAEQTYDKKFYLIDDLVLNDLDDYNRNLIDSCLKIYHKTDNDSIKYDILNVMIGDCDNDIIWPKYNTWLLNKLKVKLSKNISNREKYYSLHSISKCYNNIGFYYDNVDLNEKKALYYYNKSMIINELMGFNYDLIDSYEALGIINFNNGEVKKSLDFYMKSLEIAIQIRDTSAIANCYNNIGQVYDNLGNVKKTLEFFQKSLILRERLGDKLMLAESYNNMAWVYDQQEEKDKALEMYSNALELCKEIDFSYGIATCYNNVGGIYDDKGDFEKALKFYNQAFLIDSADNNIKGMGIAKHSIAGVYRSQLSNLIDGKASKEDIEKMRKKVLDYYNDNLMLVQESYYKEGEATTLANIASVHMENQDYIKAEKYLNESVRISEKLGYPRVLVNSSNLSSKLYEQKGDYARALEMYKLHIKMRDSLNNEENQKATIRQQTQYEFEKEQIRKEHEAKEKARVEAEELKRRNNLEYSLIFMGILLLFGLVLALGFIKVSPNVAEGLIFFAFLILFEFLLVFTEPYISEFTNNEPIYALLVNSCIALLIFPMHSLLEGKLKKRIIKKD